MAFDGTSCFSLLLTQVASKLAEYQTSALIICKTRGPHVWDGLIDDTNQLRYRLDVLTGRSFKDDCSFDGTLASAPRLSPETAQLADELESFILGLYERQIVYRGNFRLGGMQKTCASVSRFIKEVQDKLGSCSVDKEYAKRARSLLSTEHLQLREFLHTTAPDLEMDIDRISESWADIGSLTVSSVLDELSEVKKLASQRKGELDDLDTRLEQSLHELQEELFATIQSMNDCPPDLLERFKSGENPMGARRPTDFRLYFNLPPILECSRAFDYVARHFLEERLMHPDDVLREVKHDCACSDATVVRLVFATYCHFVTGALLVTAARMNPLQRDGRFTVTDVEMTMFSVADYGQSLEFAKAELLWKSLRSRTGFLDAAFSRLTGIRYWREVREPVAGCQAICSGGLTIACCCDGIKHIVHRHVGLANYDVTFERHKALRQLARRHSVFYLRPHTTADQTVIFYVNRAVERALAVKSFQVPLTRSSPQLDNEVTVVDLGLLAGTGCDGRLTTFVHLVTKRPHSVDEREVTCTCPPLVSVSGSCLRLVTCYPVPKSY